MLVLQHGGGVSGFGARNALIPATRSAVVVMANADWSGGVLDTIQEAVLAKMMPAADAPTVAGPPAREAALEHAAADPIRHGRSLAARRRIQRVPHAGSGWRRCRSRWWTPARSARSKPGPISERGGMEVSTLRLLRGHDADQHADVSHARRQDRGVPVQPPMTDTARRILLGILLLGVAGVSAELLLLGHDEDVYQLIPLALALRGRADERWVDAAAECRRHPAVPGRDGAVHLSGAVGMCLHFRANIEFQLEMDPSLTRHGLFRKAIVAKTPPALAPGAMMQLGLIGLAYTFRHPALLPREG